MAEYQICDLQRERERERERGTTHCSEHCQFIEIYNDAVAYGLKYLY
jgi:hypothetical protein